LQEGVWESRWSDFSKLGEAEGKEERVFCSLWPGVARVVRNHGSQFCLADGWLEAAHTTPAEELKSVSGNLGEEFVLERSDWGYFELREGREFVLICRDRVRLLRVTLLYIIT
jgi:hypothetical protein